MFSLEIQIFNSASKSNVPDVSEEHLEILLYGMDLYSTLLPVKPCTSISIKRLLVNINTSLNNLKPSSLCSIPVNKRPYFLLSFSAETSLAFLGILLNNPMVCFYYKIVFET